MKLLNLFKPREDRGKAVVYIHQCVGCGNCVDTCRRSALELYEIKGERFARLVYPGLCSGCGKCRKVCEEGAIEITRLTPYSINH